MRATTSIIWKEFQKTSCAATIGATTLVGQSKRTSYSSSGHRSGTENYAEQRVQQMCQRQQRSRETSRNSVSQTTARLARMHLRSVPIHSPVCRPDRLPLPVHCWYSFFLI